MAIKPQYETYRYTGEICRLQSQSIVECRLPGSEIGSVLAIQAKPVPVDCTPDNGEVRYSGKLLLCIVYEDAEGKICRAERGAEFFHKAEDDGVTPACFAKVAFRAENVQHRREGSGLYVSVIVGADIIVYGTCQTEYLLGGENIAVKRADVALCRTVCVSGEVEEEDEFDADYVGDILLHEQTAVVTSVVARAGSLDVDGELVLNVCVLKEDGLGSYERVLPFHVQIPCEEAFGDCKASARAIVKDVHLTAGVDEEKGKSKILFNYTLSVDCFVHTHETVLLASDAFSPCAKLTLKKQNGGGMCLLSQTKCVERVRGVVSLSPAIDGEYALQVALLPKAEAVCRKTEKGFETEGTVSAELLLKNADGGYKTCTLNLPFVFPVEWKGDDICETAVDCLVCGLNVRRKKDGETEAEATVKVCLRGYACREWEYVAQVEEGEKYEESRSAFSIYALREGEELWTASKRLGCMPEDLQKSNPELTFPVRAGERIFVYRQMK